MNLMIENSGNQCDSNPPCGLHYFLSKSHRSSYKGKFSACVSPGLHLVEWTRHSVDLSYFVAADALH